MDIMQPLKFEKDAQTLYKDKNYYVYCRRGQRSIRGFNLLDAAGVSRTYYLLGRMLERDGKILIPT